MSRASWWGLGAVLLLWLAMFDLVFLGVLAW